MPGTADATGTPLKSLGENEIQNADDTYPEDANRGGLK